MPVFRNYPSYADVMPISVFREAVLGGGFIDYDGFGFYATGIQESDILVTPSTFLNQDPPKWATHVSWYNR